ncbi:YfiR family protein [Pelagicoccus sp. SDUM812003]|uniref:YfiR family protein n=1 Tax=Pelagicoccus sp. SDUM812003 TaxID=3041267 RepID=UPI00280FC714|nr:YfiR family protein [Pelagicoccus sp. SDUM812003]MDQ8205270.1 YfiR family protein [Pelagicoccus sp. SDUM812003]
MKRICFVHLLVCLLAWCFCGAKAAGASDDVSQESLYAILSYKFLRYAQWPEEMVADEGELVIGVYGNSSAGRRYREAFSDLCRGLGESAGARCRVVDLSDPSVDTRQLKLVFFAEESRRVPQELMDQLRSQPVVLVGYDDAFLDRGGMIRLKTKRSQGSFDVDLDNVRAVGLDFKSSFLRLADQVRIGGKR